MTYQTGAILTQLSRFPITDGKWPFIGSFGVRNDTLAFWRIGLFAEQGDAETSATRRVYVSQSLQVETVPIIKKYITNTETFVAEMSQYQRSVFVH